MAAAKGNTTKQIEVAQFDLQTVEVNLVGTAPIIFHKWSEKARRQMLDKQMGVASTGREKKDPEADFLGSMYALSATGTLDEGWAERAHTGTSYPVPHRDEIKMPDGGFGFPAVGFKAAAVRAGKGMGAVMTDLRAAFHIHGEFVRVHGEDSLICREDMVHVGQTTDIRYRGSFENWSVQIPVQFNARAISAEQLLTLFQGAGFSVGVGEWRPERNGQYGTFKLDA